jgi:serine/threonine protein phosphatase PrpC
LVDNEILETQNRSMLPSRKRTFFGDWGNADGDDSNADEAECFDEEDTACHLQPISFSGAAAVFAIVAKPRKKRRRRIKDQGDADEVVEDNASPAAGSVDKEEAAASESDEDEHPTTLYVANVGDCRAVVGTWDGQAIELTKDHKASLPEEQARIEASGGFVHNGRLDGILAISRGFGDLAHKQDGHLVVTPDVIEHIVSPEDQFLLLASDGLFDVLSSQQVVNFVSRKLRTHGDVQLAAQELVMKAQAYLAYDNTSVIVVALNQTEEVSVGDEVSEGGDPSASPAAVVAP